MIKITYTRELILNDENITPEDIVNNIAKPLGPFDPAEVEIEMLHDLIYAIMEYSLAVSLGYVDSDAEEHYEWFKKNARIIDDLDWDWIEKDPNFEANILS
jgi:hypothetical protein